MYVFNQAASASLGSGTATGSGVFGGIGAAATRLLGAVGTLLTLSGDTPDFVDLYRAVLPLELEDINETEQYRFLPGAIEGKQFTLRLEDARFFEGIPSMSADAIVRSYVTRQTFGQLERGLFDNRLGVFVTPDTLPSVNADAVRFGGIHRVE